MSLESVSRLSAAPVRALAVVAAGLVACLVAAPPARAALLQVEGPSGAAVLIDGRPAGVLPLAGPIALEAGSYALRCEQRGRQPFETELMVADDDQLLRVVARMTPLRRRDALAYGVVFAGLGQHYVGRPRTGWVLAAAEAGGLVAALAGEVSYKTRRDDYVVLYDAYLRTVTDEEIVAARAAAADKYAQMEDAESLRDTGLLVAAGAVVVGLLDVLLRFPSLEAGAGALPALGAAPGAGTTGAGATAPALAAFAHDDRAGAAVHVGWTARF